MIDLAASIAKKPAGKEKPKPPQGPLVAALEQAGFTYYMTEKVGNIQAHAYVHPDQRAALCTVETTAAYGQVGQVVLRRTDQTTWEGSDPAALAEALKAKPLGKRKARIALAAERGVKSAKLIAGRKTPVPPVDPPELTLSVVKSVEQKAAEKKARQITAAAGVPMHVVRAVEMLGGLTDERFAINDLRGDAHYGHRMALMKTVLGYDRASTKVKSGEVGINNLVTTFYTAVGVGPGALAARAAEFADRCRALLERVAIAKKGAAKVERRTVKAVKRATATQLAVPGAVLPTHRKLSRKAQKVADEAARAAIIAEGLAAEIVAQPRPSLKHLVGPVSVRALRLLHWPNGDIGLKLEPFNSQGALYLLDNGHRVVVGVLTPTLALDVKLNGDDLATITQYVDGLAASKSEKSAEVTAVIVKTAAALQHRDEPVSLGVFPSRLPAPREGASEPRIVPSGVRLLADEAMSPILLQLEKPNSQGAISVYNNGSRITVAVVPAEILQTLRSLSDVDVVKAADQLLNPTTPSVPATPAAARHLTAVLHCREKDTVMTTEVKTSKFAAPVKTTGASAKKLPAKKAENGPRKASAYRLRNETKAAWSAFATQKGAIVQAMVKAGAVGAKAVGVTTAALQKALPKIAPKNIAFYMSTWQKDPAIVEKL